MCKLIAYYRVSTVKQGQSGLGLEAQKTSVTSYSKETNKLIIAEYTEVESGKNNSRVELQKALDHCELTGARLIIAKLDRLSRNVGFISRLQDSGVKFVAADMPEANETMIQFMSVMAQAERKAISQRTKAALQAAKARGKTLGNPNIQAARDAREDVEGVLKKARQVRSDKSLSWSKKVYKHIEHARASGASSLQAIAEYLNNMDITTARGAEWTRAAVSRVINTVQAA